MAEADQGSCCKGLSAFYDKSKPALAMISVQFGFAGMNIISKVALSQGMSHFVLVVYRHVVATLVLVPFAYVLEKKSRPALTFRVFCEIFFSALFGLTLNQNFYYAALRYTSATFACALSNMLPAVTFLMAIPFGLERVGIRSLAGQAKVLGTIICVGGAMVMTLYKGIPLKLWPSPFHLNEGKGKSGSDSENLTTGSMLVVASCISWSAWFIIQGKMSQRYSAKYTSTALMCFLATIQSAVVTLIFERNHPSVWALGWDIKLLTSVYSGVVASGMAFCIMTWCIRRKGPLFVTMFNPLLLIIVAVMSTIILDEKLHLGSVLGSILIVAGLYAVVWGKAKEMEKIMKIPKRDSDHESGNSQELSGRSRYAISNIKESIINTQQRKSDENRHEEKELATSKPKKARRDSEEICSGPATLVGVGNHVAIDCSAFDAEGLHGDDRVLSSSREGQITGVSKV